ncbi:MAG: hypothetical protein NW224_09770 [Leptolyngbyaceae cyanobacterium bins.302]|nr:hypothetical protein [Leptolyngbyaceae cyanobacterium bins.302]
MQTNKRPSIHNPQDPGVQRDSDTPIPQKPSFLFISTTLAIVITFITVVAMAYNG